MHGFKAPLSRRFSSLPRGFAPMFAQTRGALQANPPAGTGRETLLQGEGANKGG